MSHLSSLGQGPPTQFHAPTPFAAPAVATFGLHGGQMVVTQAFCGFTKRKRAAVEIAAGMCGRLSNQAPISGSVDGFETRAVEVAQAVLAKVRETEPALAPRRPFPAALRCPGDLVKNLALAGKAAAVETPAADESGSDRRLIIEVTRLADCRQRHVFGVGARGPICLNPAIVRALELAGAGE